MASFDKTLKIIPTGPPKSGKTVFALSMAELGDIGALDSEGRLRWYTEPVIDVPQRPWPFDKPRRLRTDLPMLQNATLRMAFTGAGTIYLVETANLDKLSEAVDKFNDDRGIIGIDIDSGSVYYDVLSATRVVEDDDAYGRSWGPVYEWDRLFKIKLTSGGKHVTLVAREKEMKGLVPQPNGGRKLEVIGYQPRLQRESPYWADLTVRLDLPSGAAHPTLEVTDEGTGGFLRRGEQVVDPTFKRLLERAAGVGGDGAQT